MKATWLMERFPFKVQENAAADIVVRNEEEAEISIGNPGKVSGNFSQYKGKIRILRIIKDEIIVSNSIFYKKPGAIFVVPGFCYVHLTLFPRGIL